MAQENPTTIASDNALIAEWTGPYGGVPPWDRIETGDFIPAFDFAIAAARADIDAITSNSAAPDFENTIAALEKSGAALTRIQNLFGVYSSNLNVGDIPDIELVVYPKLAAFYDEVNQNAALFARVSSVYNGKEFKKLSAVQQRLTEDHYKGFERNGANLDEAGKKRVAEINQRAATLGAQFTQNLLKDEETVTWIEKQSDLEGLPQSTIDAMAQTASANDRPGVWAVLNTRSAVDPFLTYSDNRALREKVWRAFVNRGDNGDAEDNNAIIRETLKLRAERSRLLGYPTYAHWAIERQMAKTPEAAMELMLKVWPKALARVKEEVADMQAIADAQGAGEKIEPWDYRYYAEKVRKAKYDLDFNEVKSYLQLDKLREGMFWAAGELYGFRFEEVSDALGARPVEWLLANADVDARWCLIHCTQMHPTETRALAARYGLAVADKPDSQDICFVPNGDYAAVIEKLRPGAAEPGEIMHLDGRVLGRHDGVIRYTVGQRRGLGIGGGEPLFVVRLDADARRVIVGPREALASRQVAVAEINWLGDGGFEDAPAGGWQVAVKVRSTRPPVPARLHPRGPGRAEVELLAPEEGVAPGQACVFYAPEGSRVLGGGWIVPAR